MKEYPILMSSPMVRAILADQKTETRRVVKFKPPFTDHSAWQSAYKCSNSGWLFTDGPLRDPEKQVPMLQREGGKQCPYGDLGDHLWVRETYQIVASRDFEDNCDFAVQYLADNHIEKWRDNGGEMNYPIDEKKRPSIFMPRKFSRITLEIVNIKVERLQDISAMDCITEGIERSDIQDPHESAIDDRKRYKELWESINGAGSWDKNPWVWVIQFTKINT